MGRGQTAIRQLQSQGRDPQSSKDISNLRVGVYLLEKQTGLEKPCHPLSRKAVFDLDPEELLGEVPSSEAPL